ncbi:MAG: rod shape-determining protein MreC [Pseudomonadota bacterium]
MNTTYSSGAMKPLFIRGPSLVLRFLFFAVISLILMTVDHRQNYLDGVRGVLSVVIYPLQYAVNIPFLTYRWLDESLSTRTALSKENTMLREQNRLLEAQLQKFAALETENMRLRELLQSSKKVGERMLIAELLDVDVDPFRHKIALNKGARHGVVPGQPLLDSTGIIGQVFHVGPLSSTALLITDPSHALPVQVNRNGLRALVIGTGSFSRLDVPYISKSADVQVGDLLISSGLGGRFPPDYPVATVTAVERDPGQPFAKISAAPTARLERSREVLLVWPENSSSRAAPTPADAEAPKSAAPVSAQPGISFTPMSVDALSEEVE